MIILVWTIHDPRSSAHGLADEHTIWGPGRHRIEETEPNRSEWYTRDLCNVAERQHIGNVVCEHLWCESVNASQTHRKDVVLISRLTHRYSRSPGSSPKTPRVANKNNPVTNGYQKPHFQEVRSMTPCVQDLLAVSLMCLSATTSARTSR